jgi:hypothetical protein
MRNMMFGFGSAVLVAGMLAFVATPASAGVTKNCWSHLDNEQFLADGVTPNPDYGQLVPVWANGGGHEKHRLAGYDTLLGTTESYEACVAAFAGGI